MLRTFFRTIFGARLLLQLISTEDKISYFYFCFHQFITSVKMVASKWQHEAPHTTDHSAGTPRDLRLFSVRRPLRSRRFTHRLAAGDPAAAAALAEPLAAPSCQL